LDCAVGTTFSLDLLSALMLPLSFAFFDWEQADGQPVADPLALMEALRRYGDRFTIFCQSGQIHLPPKYPPLVTFLEGCIYDVQPRDKEGVFHPKVWALRFIAEDGAIRYRVLCLSRNLTFDRCWDTVVSLDGELADRTLAIAANHPLGDLIGALPKLTGPNRPLPLARRADINRMADELRRVRFVWPDGFEGDQCRFWVAGLDDTIAEPFPARRERSLIVSPFVSTEVVQDFLDQGAFTHLVSRIETLQSLPIETLRACETVHYLQMPPSDESGDDSPRVGQGEVLEGLHAKLFVVDHGWMASVFSGSFNATNHALAHNVEFMVELVGKRSRFGVDQFLRQEKGEAKFSDLLQVYDLKIAAPVQDPNLRRIDELLLATKRAIATAGPLLRVTATEETDLFDLTLQWSRPPRWPKGQIKVEFWPITQPAERALPLTDILVFPRLSYAGLTPLIAFAVEVELGGTKRDSVFVLNLPMEGAPADRQERVLASLLAGQEQLLRYILFLLAAGDEAAAASGELVRLLTRSEKAETDARAIPCLLETMLRALHHSPEQLERVASLLEALKKAPNGSVLLSPDFQRIWEPIWQVVQERTKK